MIRLPAALLSALLLLPAAGGEPSNPFIDAYLGSAERYREAGEIENARAAVQRVLERDDTHLTALRLLAELSVELGDNDTATHAYHRWLKIVESAARRPVSGAALREVRETLLLIDPRANDFVTLSESYIKDLLKLAKQYRKQKNFHSALAVYRQVLGIDSRQAAALKEIRNIRRTGGSDLAEEDIYAGADATFGVSQEWIDAENAKHLTWATAWEKDGEHYRYKTDAGFVVLQTSAIAMEQMNRFYRQFFRYKLDGGPTPKISVHVFKSRDEYLELGQGPPVEWSGGHFTGSAVETYIGGTSGKETIRQMYGTLFHEAAHQFVSLTGKGGVPGWLNEAYASFFEGCTILSNGTVKWNQVANHRLFPLASRMDAGWMSSPTDGVRDDQGEWATPSTAPTFRILVEGKYQWGPPWYAPTWGVVYFLYNYRDEEGRPIWRDALHEYYLSGARGRPDPAAHFESIVLAVPDSPVRTIDELDPIWRAWMLELRDIQQGKKKAKKSNLDHGDAALARGDTDMATEFFEEAYQHYREDPEVLWKLAAVLEEQKDEDRALALYGEFAREMELRGLVDDPRYSTALEKIEELDPLFRRATRLKENLEASGLELAQSYHERGMPLMALEVARRMSADFSMPSALDFYERVARETGRSLARWRLAYNEFDLTGWSGGEGYQPYGKEIRAHIQDDPTVERPEGDIFTQELAYDTAFEADYSLEAEMRFEGVDRSMLGLCFGRKDSDNLHAVILHQSGSLDISTKAGAVWSVRDHREIRKTDDWRKLRIDVVDSTVDVYLDGRYIRSLVMPSRESLRGGFGLIAGEGGALFREIRVLARDPRDPASRIERELALLRVAEDESLREPGTFTGFQPPELAVRRWIQGEATTLAALRGRPILLLFWTPGQDMQIPTAPYYRHLHDLYGSLGLEFVVVLSNEMPIQGAERYLKENPLPGMRIAIDSGRKTYLAYNLKRDGWGLPRILLIDVDGTVCWEGDPGLRLHVGWEPDMQTYLDAPLADLVSSRHLAELVELLPRLDRLDGLLRNGELLSALDSLAPLRELQAAWHPGIKRAQKVGEALERARTELPQVAVGQAAAGYPRTAELLLQWYRASFGPYPPIDPEPAALLKDGVLAWEKCLQAEALLEKGNPLEAEALLRQAAHRSPTPELAQALARLQEALSSHERFRDTLQALEQECVDRCLAVLGLH